MQGLIIENISNLYKIEAEDKQIYEATARGKFKKDEISPVVGDNVEIEVLDKENKKAKRIDTKICRGRRRCRCCGNHSDSGSPDRTCHHFQRAADRTGTEHSFKDR